jgi:hypothetical protein
MKLPALAIVVCPIMTSLCWLHEPSNVRTPILLILGIRIEQIHRDAGGIAARPYQKIPLGFIDNLRPS